MTIKPVASSFDALSKPSPIANRPRATAQADRDVLSKPAQNLPSPTAERPSPVADSRRPAPTATANRPAPTADSAKPVPTAESKSDSAADVGNPNPASIKPRVSVKA